MRLSIPFWSDFIIYFEVKELKRFPKLSIPFWSDFIVNKELSEKLAKIKLSIPFWSDFIRPQYIVAYEFTKSFQSHFGLILSKIQTHAKRQVVSPFNPILVWFYLKGLKKKVSEDTLSIPFWSDFILNEILNTLKSIDLSIPFWSDFIWRDWRRWRMRWNWLSIPFWSDFITKYPVYIERPLNIFQSHFGLILSESLICSRDDITPFQSHFGLILSKDLSTLS